MGKLFDECKNHVEDDHLLLRLLVFLSSEDDIDVLLSTAPIHIVALHISDLWETRNIAKKVCTYVTHCNSIDGYKMLCSIKTVTAKPVPMLSLKCYVHI